MLGSRVAALFKEYGWAVNLLLIAIGAYFVAGTANAVVARGLHVVPTVDDVPTPVARPASSVRLPSSADFSAIANRNLLAAKRENLSPVGVESLESDPGAVTGNNYKENELRPCTVSATLRATLVADNAPQWSIAVLYDNREHEPKVFSINEGSSQIADDAALVEIRNRAIVVRRRDHFELCRAEDEGGAATRPTASVATPAPAATTGAPSGAGVTRISDTQYNIERAEIDSALSNLNEIATQARIVPSFQDGRANGFKLFSIKPGSLYSKIGLRNGDVIQKINGYELNSPDKALEVYQKLRDSSSVSIELTRRGQGTTVNYSIVP